MKEVVEKKRRVKLFKLMIDEAAFFHFKVLAGRFCGLLVYISAIGDAPPAAEVKKMRTMLLSPPFHYTSFPHPSLSLFFGIWEVFLVYFIALGFLAFYFSLHGLQIKKEKKQSALDECGMKFYSHLQTPLCFGACSFCFFAWVMWHIVTHSCTM